MGILEAVFVAAGIVIGMSLLGGEIRAGLVEAAKVRASSAAAGEAQKP